MDGDQCRNSVSSAEDTGEWSKRIGILVAKAASPCRVVIGKLASFRASVYRRYCCYRYRRCCKPMTHRDQFVEPRVPTQTLAYVWIFKGV